MILSGGLVLSLTRDVDWLGSGSWSSFAALYLVVSGGLLFRAYLRRSRSFGKWVVIILVIAGVWFLPRSHMPMRFAFGGCICMLLMAAIFSAALEAKRLSGNDGLLIALPMQRPRPASQATD